MSGSQGHSGTARRRQASNTYCCKTAGIVASASRRIRQQQGETSESPSGKAWLVGSPRSVGPQAIGICRGKVPFVLLGAVDTDGISYDVTAIVASRQAWTPRLVYRNSCEGKALRKIVLQTAPDREKIFSSASRRCFGRRRWVAYWRTHRAYGSTYAREGLVLYLSSRSWKENT